MEKILLAVNSRNADENAIRFACHLARLTHSKLTGILLEDIVVEEEVIIDRTRGVAALVETVLINGSFEDTVQHRSESVSLFNDIAREEEVDALIDTSEGITVFDVLARTRFADILIVDARTTIASVNEQAPTRFVKDILQEAECPVIIAPENFASIDNIVFYYKANKTSAFAIKQFTYLFPELRNKKARVIFLENETEPSDEEVQDLSDWLAYHYNVVDFVALQGNMKEAFFNYLLEKKNDFVVMGNYGSGLLASFFKNEDGDEAGRTTSLPVFVSHY